MPVLTTDEVTMESAHIPVMPAEALEMLAPRDGGLYVDATFGAGGHTQLILERVPGARVIALDTDPAVTPAFANDRLTFVHANFRTLSAVLTRFGVVQVDGVLFDFGFSSLQLADPKRGLSFNLEAPLDMRLDPSRGPSALDLLRTLSERELTLIIEEFGEERAAKKIARALIARRSAGSLPTTTAELARLVAGILHISGHRERLHPATRTFQALRIAVNDELRAIEDGLSAAIEALAPGGRIVAISFHSLEDRIIKQRFRSDSRLHPIKKKPLVAGATELATNPRARSAKLRAAERTGDAR